MLMFIYVFISDFWLYEFVTFFYTKACFSEVFDSRKRFMMDYVDPIGTPRQHDQKITF